LGFVSHPDQRRGIGVAEAVEHVGELGIFRRAVGGHNVPECDGLWRRRLGIKCADVELEQIGCDVAIAAPGIPAPQAVPVTGRKILFA